MVNLLYNKYNGGNNMKGFIATKLKFEENKILIDTHTKYIEVGID